MRFIKNLFIIEYVIYLFVNIDARINPKFINGSHSFLFAVYVSLIVIEWMMINIYQMTISINRRSKIGTVSIIIIFLYILGFISCFSSRVEIELSVMLILTIYFTGKMINKLNCMEEILLVSFWIPTLFFLIICIRDKIDMVMLLRKLNFKYMFSAVYTMRLRVDFKFYNVNAAGNLASCLLCVALMIICLDVLKKRGAFRSLFYAAVAFDICVLLLTGSRTAILSVLICYLIIIGSRVWSYLNKRNTYLNILLRNGFVLLILLGVYFFFSSFFIKYIIGRNYAFDNLKLLRTMRQRIFGLGLVPPGDFLDLIVSRQKGNFMDNYYIYVYVTMGLLGLIVIGSALLYLGIGLTKKAKKNSAYISVVACYVACIIGGVAETNVLYHLFPSCAIYFSIFFAVLGSRRNEFHPKGVFTI